MSLVFQFQRTQLCYSPRGCSLAYLDLHHADPTIITRICLEYPPERPIPLVVSGDITSTTSSTLRSRPGWNHFLLALSSCNHSLSHLCQKLRTSSWIRRHLFLGLKSVPSTDVRANWPPICPCRKWLGVSGTSSEETAVWNAMVESLLDPRLRL